MYEYTPYPESVEKARFIQNLRDTEIFARIGNRPTFSSYYVGSYYFAPNAKGLPQSEWFATWDENFVAKVARWIDRQPVNVNYLGALVAGVRGLSKNHLISLVPLNICGSLYEAEIAALTQGNNYVLRYDDRLTPRVRVLRW